MASAVAPGDARVPIAELLCSPESSGWASARRTLSAKLDVRLMDCVYGERGPVAITDNTFIFVATYPDVIAA